MSWFVLIGGESLEEQGSNLLKRQFLHTSLNFIGQAYENLRLSGVKKDNIIIIAQLEDYLRSPHVTINSYPYKSIQESCSRLINEGGVDYDYEKVNPGTVWNVLKGIRSEEYPKVVPNDSGTIFFGIYSHGDYHPSHPIPTTSTTTTSSSSSSSSSPSHSTPLVPSTPSSTSQQNDPLHPTTLPAPINPYNHEWFAHMPYPIQSQELAEEMLSFVSTVGASGEKFHTPERYLYATQLRSIFIHLFSLQPNRPIIGLLNFCFSGGMIEFMRQPIARDYCGANNWPLFLMSASQSNHPALVGGLWSDFFSLFSNEIKTINEIQKNKKSTSTITPTITSTITSTVEDNSINTIEQSSQQQQQQQQQFFENCFENIKNRLRKRTLSSNNILTYPSTISSSPPTNLSLAFQMEISQQQQQQQQQLSRTSSPQTSILTLKQFFLSVRSLYFQNCSYELHGHVISRVFAGRKTKIWSSFSVDILPMLSGGENGEPNYQELQQLQETYRRKGITIWYSNQWGILEANLVEAVKEARKYIAIPDAVYGEHSGISDMPISILVSNNYHRLDLK